MEDSKSFPSPITILISKQSVYPDRPSSLGSLPLTVIDARLLSFHYSQLNFIFHRPSFSSTDLLNHLRSTLSRALSLFPPLAGRLSTDADGFISIACNDAGVDFVHAAAPGLSIADVLVYDADVPAVSKDLVLLNGVANIEGLSVPLTAVQATELADGVSVGFSINHAVADGTATMSFLSAWSELCRGVDKISQPPDFRSREYLPKAAPPATNIVHACRTVHSPATRDRVFHFSREAMQNIKVISNSPAAGGGGQISSFQSLCALVWRSVTKARRLSLGTVTTILLAANFRGKMKPPLGDNYFGNAIMTLATSANVEEVVGRGVSWCAQLLHRNVAELGDEAVRKEMESWKEPLTPGTSDDGPFLVVAYSPRFPVYDIDMGWGRPVGLLSGTANKMDGVVLAFPATDGSGSVDLEMCFVPETMARLESDSEFMQYVSGGDGMTSGKYLNM